MTFAWFALAAVAIFEKLAPPAWVGWGLIATAAYFLGLPLLRGSPLARG